METLAQRTEMSFEEVLAEFTAVGRLPKRAIEYSLSNWPEFGPRFVQLIEDYSSGANRSEYVSATFVLVFAVLGEAKEKSFYRPLCNILLDKEFACSCLDDFITNGLTGVLINVCDGDPGPLQKVVECKEAEEFVRSAAVEALAYLSVNGDLPSFDMRAYLDSLYNKLQSEADNFVWAVWISTVANLECTDLVPLAEYAIEIYTPEYSITKKDFHDLLRKSQNTPDKRITLEMDHIRPFGKTADHFANWYGFTPECLVSSKKTSYFPEVEDHTPKVGRNETCPCGSGKKFKKCCAKSILN